MSQVIRYTPELENAGRYTLGKLMQVTHNLVGATELHVNSRESIADSNILMLSIWIPWHQAFRVAKHAHMLDLALRQETPSHLAVVHLCRRYWVRPPKPVGAWIVSKGSLPLERGPRVMMRRIEHIELEEGLEAFDMPDGVHIRRKVDGE